MPLTTISTVLSSIKTATDIAKLIKSSTTTLEEAEVKLKFAELIGALADVKIEVSEIQEQLIAKNEKIKELEGEQKLNNEITFEDDKYWLESKGKKDGPYCQCCYDTEKKLVRLIYCQRESDEFGDSSFHLCRACNNSY